MRPLRRHRHPDRRGKLKFKVVPASSGCGDEAGQVFSINARATVIKGYGKLANARGKLKITGVYDRGKGTFTAKFAGTLTNRSARPIEHKEEHP